MMMQLSRSPLVAGGQIATFLLLFLGPSPVFAAEAGKEASATEANAPDDASEKADEAGEETGDSPEGEGEAAGKDEATLSADAASSESGEPAASDLEVSDPADSESGARPSALDADLGLRLYSRAFRYTDSLAQLDVPGANALLDYNLDAGPMPYLHVRWYPGAHFRGGALAHIGVEAGFEQGIGTNVNYYDPATAQDTKFGQNHRLFFAGLRGRIPVGLATFGVVAKYGNHSFTLNEKEGVDPATLFADAQYSYVEAGADVQLRVGKVSLGGQAAYSHLLSLGSIADDTWFPEATARSLHFGGEVGFWVIPTLAVVTGIDARIYAFDFNPIPLDRAPERVAGGATDRFLSASLSLRYVLGASQSGDDEGAADDDGGGGFDSFD